jgi:SecD/SecF fusion protein
VRSRGNLIIIGLVLTLMVGTVALIATRSPVLGLDLRGGSEIVLKAQPDPGVKVTPDIMNQAVAIYNKRLNALGTTEPTIQKDGTDQITIDLPGEKDPNRVNSLIGSTGTLYFLPLQDALTPGVSRSVVSGAGISEKNSLWDLLNPVQKNLGTGTPSGYFAFDSNKRPRNTQPAKTPEQLLQQLQVTKLPAGWTQLAVPESKIAVSCTPSASRSCPGNNIQQGHTYWYMFDLPAKDQLLTGKLLSSAKADFDPQSGQPVVSMTFNDRGGKLFKDITSKLAAQGKADYDAAKATDPTAQPLNYVRQFAVILDGQLETYPYIDFQRTPDGIGKNSQITGVTASEAKDVATVLASGSLPVEFARLSQTQVSATLGKASLRQGLIAGLAGLLIVMIWMVVFYRFLGVIADIALLIYAALYFGVILAIPVTLTLPGIAGLILTIGVAADANVVVFERIKEEVRAGRSVRTAISGGYKKGFSTIIDANAVTLITAAVLFVASQSSVRGFAFLLGIGVIVSMFTAVAATRAMLGILGGFRWFNNAAFMGATAKPVRWKIDVVGKTKMWFAISGAIILVGLGSLAIQGLNRGLDFTGGTRLSFAITSPGGATVDDVRAIGGTINKELSDGVVRGTGAPVSSDHYSGFQVEAKEVPADAVSNFRFALLKKYGQNSVPADKFSQSTVSGSFGREILRSAVLAFIFSIFLIVVYLAFRFDWRYALPTIAALVHDLLITIGVYSITGREVTSATVAAVLTILGYSLYDTIIVFDRVRENERILRKHTYGQIVNISLWETLTRSLTTSMLTLLPIVSLLLFGGATLKDFAFALLIGIVSGAYSSFFVASPLLVMLKQREPEFAKRAGSDELPAVFLRSKQAEAPAPAAPSAPAPSPAPAAATAAAAPAPAPAPTGNGTPAAPKAGTAVEDRMRAARERRGDRKRRR